MDQDVEQLNENEVLWAQLFTATRVVERARELELSRANVSLIQAMVLHVLKISTEPLTPTKLARMLCREPHSMSALVDRMEKQGLIRKKHDLSRKNLVRVALTAKGEEAFRRQRSTKVVPTKTTSLTNEEREILANSANKMRLKAIELIREMSLSPYD